jgi:hypothetical protein
VTEHETSKQEPAPELGEVVDDYIPGAAELAVVDPGDHHEVMVRMDDHDVRMLLSQVQTAALRKWVYELPDGTKGLTVGAVQDISQRMNWMGKCRIGVMPETLRVEQIEADEGNGPEPFWVATIFARDEVTGAMLPGSSMEPQRMRLRPETAKRKRAKGMQIPEDNAIFDRFARTKAIQKATRNAIAAFIPEEIEQTVIAMFANDPKRVERIRTEAEQKMEDRPAPLVDDEAKAKLAEARALYDEVRDLGGAAVTEFPPGKFAAYVLNAQHSQETLDALVDYVRGERDRLVEKYRSAA